MKGKLLILALIAVLLLAGCGGQLACGTYYHDTVSRSLCVTEPTCPTVVERDRYTWTLVAMTCVVKDMGS